MKKLFGFVTAYKPELRVKEYEMYKAVYCSLCRDLGKKYGFVSRFSLSYDFTFLTLLYLSVRDGCISTHRKRCVCNPLKSCNYIERAEVPAFPLAAAQIMLYYKLMDNIEDEGFFKSTFCRALKLLSKKGYKKAVLEFPLLDEVFKNYFKGQTDIERNNIFDIDKAADPTAKMLSKLFELCGVGEETRALSRLGYCMGRWIYILDAAADLKEDIRKNRYNPLKERALKEDNLDAFLKETLTYSLNCSVNEAIAAFELVEIMRFKNILGNIIYLGLFESQNKILNCEEKRRNK